MISKNALPLPPLNIRHKDKENNNEGKLGDSGEPGKGQNHRKVFRRKLLCNVQLWTHTRFEKEIIQRG